MAGWRPLIHPVRDHPKSTNVVSIYRVKLERVNWSRIKKMMLVVGAVMTLRVCEAYVLIGDDWTSWGDMIADIFRVVFSP
jgi:hypothetical protein